MSDVLEFYQQQASNLFSNTAWAQQLQKEALQDFNRLGFPSRKVEDWKYTAVHNLVDHRFLLAEDKNTKPQSLHGQPEFETTLHINHGVVFGIDALQKNLPQGVIVLPLKEAIDKHPDLTASYLGKILPHAHAFQALNTAMMQSGVFIFVPKEVQLDTPIILSHWQNEPNHAVYLRHLIVAESGAKMSVAEIYHGGDEATYFTNTMTEIHAAPGAEICHYKIQEESRKAYHIGHLAVYQAGGSDVESHMLSLGGHLVRSDVSITLAESDSRCLLNGLYAPMGQQHMDHHTSVHHQAPSSYSAEDYKGILSGQGRAVFNGKVVVAPNAQKTGAKQQNKNLLLSEKAEIDTKPQLEIFADDVQCTHGATVGQLDEEALFYLATRGIDRGQASRYLIQAFAAENLQIMPNQRLSQWMDSLLKEQLNHM